MNYFAVVIFIISLCSQIAFSQRSNSYFNPRIEWLTLEQALKMNPDDVEHLKLKRNKTNSVPPEIFNFTQLKSLSISGMRLTSIPEEIAVFQKLEFLDFSRNKIESLPLSFCGLKSLEIIVANRNPLGYLPYCLGHLQNLVAIDLWDTDVSTLPDSLQEVTELKTVDFQGVNLRIEEQEALQKRFPWVQFRFDKPCNCFK